MNISPCDPLGQFVFFRSCYPPVGWLEALVDTALTLFLYGCDSFYWLVFNDIMDVCNDFIEVKYVYCLCCKWNYRC